MLIETQQKVRQGETLASPRLTRVALEDADLHDLHWIQQALAIGRYGFDLDYALREIGHDLLQLWRFEFGHHRGVILTRLETYPGAKALEIWLLAGRFMIPHAEPIRNSLLTFARSQACTAVLGYAERPGLRKLYERLLPDSNQTTMYFKEI